MDSDLDYCRDLLASRDYGVYLIALMLPRKSRPGLLALGALRVMLRDIAANVTEPTLGYIRLQWWREQIDAVISGTPFAAEPILRSLNLLRVNATLLERFMDDFENVLNGGIVNQQNFTALIEDILSETEKARYRKLSSLLIRIENKYDGTRWRARPPFLALRLWLKSVCS